MLNPPGRDASGRAEKGMTAAWLVAWAVYSTDKNGLVVWFGIHQNGKRKWIERQCRGSTHKGEMLVGQHGEETADGIHWKRIGTSLLMTKKSFGCYKSWVQVKLTVAKRVVLVPREKKYLGPLHMGKWVYKF